jgi:hypothetical protein
MIHEGHDGSPRDKMSPFSGAITPSPCTQGEGWGGGLCVTAALLIDQKKPSPYPTAGVPSEGTGDDLPNEFARRIFLREVSCPSWIIRFSGI